MKNTR